MPPRIYKKKRTSVIGAIKKFTGNRYGRGSKQLITKGIPRLYKDVMMMKNLFNVEKKQYNNYTSSYIQTGSIDQNSSGHLCIDITPSPAQGITSTT